MLSTIILYLLEKDATFTLKSHERGLKYSGKEPLLHPTQLQKIPIFNWPTENMEPQCCSVLPNSTQSALR